MQPIISKETDPHTHPNPVYEIVPRDLATRSNKAAVITDQPRIQSSQSLPSESPPSPLIQEPSRISDTTPPVTTLTSLRLVTENPSNTNNDQENTATLSKAIHSAPEPSQALLTHVLISSAAERPTYISTSEYYGDTSFSSRHFKDVHSYYYFTIVAAIVVGLCLDFVVLLAVFLPALWFANKVSGVQDCTKHTVCMYKCSWHNNVIVFSLYHAWERN